MEPLVGFDIFRTHPRSLRVGSCRLAPLRPLHPPSHAARDPLPRAPPASQHSGAAARALGRAGGLSADAAPPRPRRRVRPPRGRGRRGGGGEELHQQVPAARGQRWHARLPPPVSAARFSLPLSLSSRPSLRASRAAPDLELLLDPWERERSDCMDDRFLWVLVGALGWMELISSWFPC